MQNENEKHEMQVERAPLLVRTFDNLRKEKWQTNNNTIGS
jgi:hypothetical protein